MQGCKSWLQRGRARAGVSPDTVCFCARLRQGEWYSGDDAGVMRHVVAQWGLQRGRPRCKVVAQWGAETWSELVAQYA